LGALFGLDGGEKFMLGIFVAFFVTPMTIGAWIEWGGRQR
jgi:hypothetical protein